MLMIWVFDGSTIDWSRRISLESKRRVSKKLWLLAAVAGAFGSSTSRKRSQKSHFSMVLNTSKIWLKRAGCNSTSQFKRKLPITIPAILVGAVEFTKRRGPFYALFLESS